MSFRSRPVVHQPSKSSVEEYSLPKWDRHGNLVGKAAKKPAVKKIEEVDEVVKPPTVAEIEAIREAAYNEGFEQGYASGMAQGEREGRKAGHSEGFEQGHQEGLEQGQVKGVQQALQEEQVKTAEKLQVFDAAAQQLGDQLAIEQAELEQALLGVAMRIAAQVIQDELQLSPEHIKPLVHAAIQSLPNPDEKLTLKLNPMDIALVDSIAESHWTLEPDSNVKRGGCQVKSGFSYVDYTLDHRYDSALSLLLNQWKPAETDTGQNARQPFSKIPLLDEHSDRLDSSPASTAGIAPDPESSELPATDANDSQRTPASSETTTPETATPETTTPETASPEGITAEDIAAETTTTAINVETTSADQAEAHTSEPITGETDEPDATE
ncbi:MAG: FliH/SctL family protein [Reinekea sp.]